LEKQKLKNAKRVKEMKRKKKEKTLQKKAAAVFLFLFPNLRILLSGKKKKNVRFSVTVPKSRGTP
jgi:hypothetical protein